jgi:uncharacterized membrane protein YqaE (UPF0057 family)
VREEVPLEKMKLTNEQKRMDIDLYIIIATTLSVLGVYMGFQNQFTIFVQNQNIHILLRTLVSALLQFGVAGIGITIVSVFRKESFLTYGLKCKGATLSILLCVLCYVPYIIFIFVTKQVDGYLPFQSVWVTKEVLASGFPINIIGMILIAIAWGFFEGFNYVIISDKINKRCPSKNKWLNWGAIVCAVLCILIHGFIGITPEGIIEMLTVLIIVYGMLMVKEVTGNVWGCVFIFVFLWNAF